jgi:hypothetical protein
MSKLKLFSTQNDFHTVHTLLCRSVVPWPFLEVIAAYYQVDDIVHLDQPKEPANATSTTPFILLLFGCFTNSLCDNYQSYCVIVGHRFSQRLGSIQDKQIRMIPLE